MQRRGFIKAVTTASGAAGAVSAQQATRPVSTESVKITTVAAESAAETIQRFFSASQFATLQRLSALLQPAANGRPGAVEAGAADFLDFWVGVSLQPRQDLYCAGLDFVDAECRRLFSKPLTEVSDQQADRIIRPLLAPWTYDAPADYRQRFLSELRADVRSATMNSKEMSQVAGAGRRRRGAGGGAYWLPIDPIR